MASTRSRGRLPQRVYWVRRSVVLVVALALVFAIARLIGGTGSDQTPAADQASQASSTQTTKSQAPTLGPVAPTQALRKKASSAPLLAPTGPCNDDEVSVVPVVPRAAAGGPIAVHLRLEGTQPACTFAISPDSLVVKIVSGPDRIWSTQDCPKAIRPDSVVVRSGIPTDVVVTWSGRRSDDTCSSAPDWAFPGFYHVYAAALGSAPSDVQFEVTLPTRKTITRTARPHAKASATASSSARASSTAKPSATPTKKSGGSVCGGDNAAGSC